MGKILFTLFLAISITASGQEKNTEKAFSVNGIVDTYYSSNLSNNSLGTVGFLSDVPAHGFGLGMVNVIFSYRF